MKIKNLILLVILLTITAVYSSPVKSQSLKENPVLDEKVRKFLAENARQWYDMNVPSVDGQLLYDIIIKNKYKAALEIGTSTGHSGNRI
jgi:predicted O-methyltransferase YrrM